MHAAVAHASQWTAAPRRQQAAPAARQQRSAALPAAATLAGAARPALRRATIAGAAAPGGLQRPLTNQERKAKRAEAQRLGRNLCTVNLGQKGLTPAFLEGFRAALAGNELVKVKLGACDEGVDEVAEALAQAGDCVLVHKIGFTLTFFRDATLPPPPPLRAVGLTRRQRGPAAAAQGDGNEGEEGEELGADDELDAEVLAYLESEDAFSDSDSEEEEEEEEEEEDSRPNSSKRQAAAAKAAKAKRPPPPPEFTIIS